MSASPVPASPMPASPTPASAMSASPLPASPLQASSAPQSPMPGSPIAAASSIPPLFAPSFSSPGSAAASAVRASPSAAAGLSSAAPDAGSLASLLAAARFLSCHCANWSLSFLQRLRRRWISFFFASSSAALVSLCVRSSLSDFSMPHSATRLDKRSPRFFHLSLSACLAFSFSSWRARFLSSSARFKASFCTCHSSNFASTSRRCLSTCLCWAFSFSSACTFNLSNVSMPCRACSERLPSFTLGGVLGGCGWNVGTLWNEACNIV
mmetsp:Transcript_98764/g.171143  ORF Transcript_98764/g.171143 Transcript_98764/m.171143 type:complete len:267 (+) Transcript_98764:60-860(+)